MTLEEYKRQYEKADTGPGWAAIDASLKTIYPEQEPKHFVPPMHHSMGGTEPLDGISLYKSTAGGMRHHHLITYGFSELYFDEAAFGKEFSRFGFELTFRVKPSPGDSGEPYWAANLLQNIGKYVYKSGNWFEPFDLMPAHGPIRTDTDTAICALLFVPDPELPPVDTPHGKLAFLQVFGITEKELAATERLYDKAVALAEWHKKINPFFVTVLERKDA